MSIAINSVVIGGNCTASPELRYTPAGKAVASFTVAINEGTRERQETTFIDVTVWDKLADIASKHLSKGSQVVIDGRLHLDTWEDRNGGGRRSKITIVANRLHLVGRQPEEQDEPQQSRYMHDDRQQYAGNYDRRY